MESRFKRWTDGATGQVVMGIENIKQEDEGAYKCVLNGEIEHEFSVYVTGNEIIESRNIFLLLYIIKGILNI